MSTQIFEAMAGKITDEMSLIAQKEGLDENAVLENVKMGKIVILKNNQRKNSIPCAIGENLNVKICANIGSFDFESEIKQELDKVRVIEQIGVDVLMDLSCDKNSDEIRKKVLEASTLPVGSAPLLQTFKTMTDNGENVAKLTKDKILADIEKHCSDGVDFVALECAVTKFVVEQLQKQDRLTGIVSASGGMLANYILVTGLENPLYQYFDEILDILRTYDVTLCLASALVSGSICDATDRAQVAETVVMGELIRRAKKSGVQVMTQGLGHISLDKIQNAVNTTKQMTEFAPLFAYGPFVCDCAIGYDNITSAIGASVAAQHGADMLTCVTPAENLGIANIKQIREGIMCAKIAAHSADVAKKNKKALEAEVAIGSARKKSDTNALKDCAIDKTIFANYPQFAQNAPYVRF